MGKLVDFFAGGGGASTGMERAYGRPLDLAVNHDPEAIAMHEANHPETQHAVCDVFEFDIPQWLADDTWDAWWASPDCTHHSRAKGGKPVSNKRRALADVVVETVERLPAWQRPRVIHLENVPEFVEWGPLDETGRPDKARKGELFNAWRARLEACGYRVEHRVLVAADYGDPTTRKRLCLIARCDGLPIVWPQPTHFNPKAKLPKDGKARREERRRRAKLQPWRTAAECIDWSIPGKSIFGRKKPLADATLKRVARGTWKFVIDNPKPFLVPLTHHGERRHHGLDEPLPTITCANRGELGLVVPHVVAVAHGDSGGRREYPIDDPLGTVTVGGAQHAVVSAHITKFRSGATGHAADEPLHTITANSFEKRGGGAAPLGVVEAAMAPHLVGVTQSSSPRNFAIDAPINTITTAKGGEHLLASAFVSRVDMASAADRNGVASAEDPLRTITTAGPFAVASAHMLRLQGSARSASAVDEPLGAVCAGGKHHAQVAAFMAQHNLDNVGHAMGEPVSTIVSRGSTQGVVEVALTPEEVEAGCERVLAFMLKYYGNEAGGHGVDEPIDTVTTKDRFALITVHIDGVPYRIFDIRIRMLTARELFNAQGFPPGYIIDPMVPLTPLQLAREKKRGSGVTHKRMSKGSSIAKCGNSVPPGLAYALAKANAPPMSRVLGRDRWTGEQEAA